MNSMEFNQVMCHQIDSCTDMLGCKAAEYATDDRLHNFKIAAEMQNCNQKQALAGMMAKHTVSIYDMCNSGASYSREQWSEKITDHMNYLILLRAMVEEELEGQTTYYADGSPVRVVEVGMDND